MMLTVRGFSKWYDGRAILRGIDLDVARGETVAVIGKSGCGKSTLLRHVARLEDASTGPVEGEVRLEGLRSDLLRASERELARHRIRGKKIGMLFQHSALFDFLSVEANIVWPLREVEGLAPRAARARARECLTLVELAGDDAAFVRREASSLAGGERKRVALARTLALRPELVLSAEPTTGLDPPTVTEINALIQRLKRAAGLTAVLTSHDMASTLKVADRIAMIKDGRLAWTGPAERALEQPEVRAFMEGAA